MTPSEHLTPHLVGMKKIVPVHRVSFWKGVLRDYLLRTRWMLKFLGNKSKRLLLRSIFSNPLPEGQPMAGQFFLSAVVIFFCPYNPTPPPIPDKPPAVPPQRAWFRSISGPFRSVSVHFGSVSVRFGPFRVCFGSVLGPFRGVGWSGRGASVREKNITKHTLRIL